ncbi:hypothetical protein ACO2I3_21480 [Leptospira interrogans]
MTEPRDHIPPSSPDHAMRSNPIAWVGRSLLRIAKGAVDILLALLLLFEEWGWRPLANLIARLRRFEIWARFENWLTTLPPYGALCAFVLPSCLIFPLKIAAVYLVATGHFLTAVLLLLGAKVAGTAILARIFVLTQPKLMQIGWFASLYNWVMPWKEALFERIRASWAWRYARVVKARAKLAARRAWETLRPHLERVRTSLRDLWRRLMLRAQS